MVEATYKYLQNLRDAGPKEYLFNEMKDIGAMQFMFAEKNDSIATCKGLARSMPQFNDENVDQLIRARYVVDQFDQEKTREIAGMMCDPKNLNIYMRSKSFEGKTDQVDKWYATKYSVDPLSESLLAKINSPSPAVTSKELGLPPPNQLVPTNFDLLGKDSDRSHEPVLLKEWPGCTYLWYKKDDKYERPKSIMTMKLYTTDCLIGHNPEARVFALLWKEIADEYLREFNYMANEAKLDFSISVKVTGIELTWSGFNDTLP